jgi:hypothetical protein
MTKLSGWKESASMAYEQSESLELHSLFKHVTEELVRVCQHTDTLETRQDVADAASRSHQWLA